MNYLNGGYAMIKHNATQDDLAKAYKTKKPILLYDENGFAYWAKITETVTTVDDETVYTYAVTKLNQIESLIDNAGNLRFIDGDGVPIEQTGIDITYCKWSLSGTHLMLVIAGTIADTTAINNNTLLGEFIIPDFVANKIFPVWGVNIESKNISCVADNWSIQQLNVVFLKVSGQSKLQIRTSGGGTFTATADRGFRMQFDLLIDNDYSE